MELQGIRQKVFLDRYSLKDEAGTAVEQTPEEMWRRVAHAVAKVEKGKKNKDLWEDKFYKAMEDFKFVPGGRVLAGAGTGYAVTYYNCFVIPSPPDSRDGILDNLKAMIEIMARGGGVGVNLSSLRPRGARVKKVNGFSSGPCNWAEMYSLATHDIIQQGGSRRGALMLMLWDWHPDIEEFITVKQDLSRINGANLSVCASDKFMEAVKADADWDLVFPDIDDPEYDTKWDGILDHWLKLGKKVKVHKTVKARHLWDLICDAAWRSAEPGLVFMERYNKWYNNWYWNTINCVNPCGEEGLPAWGVCNLASLNVSAFVKDWDIDKAGWFDYESLAEHARIGVRFQDNVVDADQYVYPEIKKMQKEGERRIGLGTLGLADALIKMKLRYGSEDALPVVDKIYQTIRDAAYDESVNIAAEKGAFPRIDKKKHLQGYFIKQLPLSIRKKLAKHGVRNSVLLQAAPTGTTSLLSGASSGIEPVYEFEYYHTGRLGKQLVYHSLYGDWKAAHPDETTKPDYFVSANDLAPEDHVKIQAIVQKYVDASISKTVNAPNAHTVEDVKNLYMMAYDMGCKGITYMRDGSRQGVLVRADDPSVASGQAKKEEPKAPETNGNGHATRLPSPEGEASGGQANGLTLTNGHSILPRPTRLEGATYKMVTPIGHTFVTINNDEKGTPFEVFITIGKSGSDVSAMAEALGRLISLNLRIMNGGVPPREKVKRVVDQLVGIGGSKAVGFGENRVRSLPDAVAKVLSMHYGLKAPVEKTNGVVEKVSNGNGIALTNGHAVELVDEKKEIEEKALQPLPLETKSLMDICPECGSATLALEEGCKKCYGCGYAEC